jgi:hypothetical protein
MPIMAVQKKRRQKCFPGGRPFVNAIAIRASFKLMPLTYSIEIFNDYDKSMVGKSKFVLL